MTYEIAKIPLSGNPRGFYRKEVIKKRSGSSQRRQSVKQFISQFRSIDKKGAQYITFNRGKCLIQVQGKKQKCIIILE